jgi:hypothetical protein
VAGRAGEKALLYHTARDRAVYLPATEGYTMLLSVDRPDEFIAAVRRASGPR